MHFRFLILYPTFVSFVPARLSGLLRGVKKKKKKNADSVAGRSLVFVMEMFLFTPPHINLAHLICSLLLTMSTRSLDRARPRHVGKEERIKGAHSCFILYSTSFFSSLFFAQ